jgi:hypothetical protein
MPDLAPITLFVYNRLDHTIKTITELQKNKLANESELFIFSDAPKNNKAYLAVEKVRNFIKTVDGFKKITIIERQKNYGLAASIIDGVSKIVNDFGKVIVLEDDLVTSKYFLTFLNDALNEHINNEKIMSIAGYSFPIEIPKDYSFDVYIFYRCMSWGWATWKSRWENVDWSIGNIKESINHPKFIDNFNRGGEDLYPMLIKQLNKKVNSWAIRWCLHHYKTNSACLYPVISTVKNIGFDGSGVHCGVDPSFDNVLIDDREVEVKFNNKFNPKIVTEIQRIHLSKNLFRRILNKSKNYFLNYVKK